MKTIKFKTSGEEVLKRINDNNTEVGSDTDVSFGITGHDFLSRLNESRAAWADEEVPAITSKATPLSLKRAFNNAASGGLEFVLEFTVLPEGATIVVEDADGAIDPEEGKYPIFLGVDYDVTVSADRHTTYTETFTCEGDTEIEVTLVEEYQILTMDTNLEFGVAHQANDPIILTFNNEISEDVGNSIVITDASDATVATTLDWDVDRKVLTITPNPGLAYLETYTLSVSVSDIYNQQVTGEVEFDVADGLNDAEILTFNFVADDFTGEIDNVNHTIIGTVPLGAEVGTRVAVYTTSVGATVFVGAVEQESGVTTNDFTNPLTYIVTSEDGSVVHNWVVTVTVAAE